MGENAFYIDKITRSIEDAATGESLETEVLPIETRDLKQMGKKNGWRFNWKMEWSYSFEAGFDGVVAFRAKTKLIKHYIDSLGAEILFKDRMCIYEKSARKLVNSYFKGYLN